MAQKRNAGSVKPPAQSEIERSVPGAMLIRSMITQQRSNGHADCNCGPPDSCGFYIAPEQLRYILKLHCSNFLRVRVAWSKLRSKELTD